MKKPKRGEKGMPHHLMPMRPNPTTSMITMDVAKANLSMAKTKNPGGVQSQDGDKKSLSFTVGSQITRRMIARNTKEILYRVKFQTRTSKRARMVPPCTTPECKEGEDCLIIEDEDFYSVVRDVAMSWVMDSGVSFHITSHKEYFTSYIYQRQYWLGEDGE
jgi:hypothetical protein